MRKPSKLLSSPTIDFDLGELGIIAGHDADSWGAVGRTISVPASTWPAVPSATPHECTVVALIAATAAVNEALKSGYIIKDSAQECYALANRFVLRLMPREARDALRKSGVSRKPPAPMERA